MAISLKDFFPRNLQLSVLQRLTARTSIFRGNLSLFMTIGYPWSDCPEMPLSSMPRSGIHTPGFTLCSHLKNRGTHRNSGGVFCGLSASSPYEFALNYSRLPATFNLATEMVCAEKSKKNLLSRGSRCLWHFSYSQSLARTFAWRLVSVNAVIAELV